MSRMIHTEESLQRMALKSGATVHLDGRPFNASRERVALRPVPAPTPKPTSAPTPTPTPAPVTPAPINVSVVTDPELTTAVEDLARTTERNTELQHAILKAVASIKFPGRPRKWSVEIVRDSRTGLLERLEFEAKE